MTRQQRLATLIEESLSAPNVPTRSYDLMEAARHLHKYFCLLDNEHYRQTFDAKITIDQLADAFAQVEDSRRVLDNRQ